MDCRRWPMPNLRRLDVDHFECICNFINEQSWMYRDLRIAPYLNIGKDWLECFFVYVTTYPLDYEDLTNAPHDARAVAAFLWNNMEWMEGILLYFTKHIQPSFLNSQ